MAQYRFSVQKPISRGKGKSVVAKAAYNARTAIREERTGELKDYSRQRDEVLFSGIFVDPKREPPEWIQDRAALWNAASAAEKRKDAREAQEIIVNLPHELNQQQREWLLKDFVREQLTRDTGRVVDVNIHAAPEQGDERNIHAHLLMTVREIGPDGFGKRLPEVTPEQIEHWRERWAEMGARALERAGYQQEAERYRVEHLNLKEQWKAALDRGDLAHAQTLDREPTKHLGPEAAAMERKGAETDRGNAYRDTVDRNTELAGLKAQLAATEKEIAVEREREFTAAERTTGNVRPPAALTRTASEIWTAWQQSDNAQAFAAALADRGMTLARVSKEEARVSEAVSSQAKRERQFAPTYREGEIVVVNEQAQVYRLSPRTTGAEFRDIQKFMGTLDQQALPSLDAAAQRMREREEEGKRTRQVECREYDRWVVGPQRGGMVEHQAWALDQAKAADQQRRDDERRRDEERMRAASEGRRSAGEEQEIDVGRFRTDPSYRREVTRREALKLREERGNANRAQGPREIDERQR